jgi:hypothetical protein
VILSLLVSVTLLSVASACTKRLFNCQLRRWTFMLVTIYFGVSEIICLFNEFLGHNDSCRRLPRPQDPYLKGYVFLCEFFSLPRRCQSMDAANLPTLMPLRRTPSWAPTTPTELAPNRPAMKRTTPQERSLDSGGTCSRSFTRYRGFHTNHKL